MTPSPTVDLSMLDHFAPAKLDTSIFRNNLASLRNTQPALAAELEATPPDGRFFAVRKLDDTWDYMGAGQEASDRTSAAPLLRAKGLYVDYKSKADCIFLADCTSGVELAYLLARCGLQVSVFVRVQSTSVLARILATESFAAALENGRLLFVQDETLEADVRGIRQQIPGIAVPQAIIRPPGTPDEDIQRIQSIIVRCFTPAAPT